MTGSDELPRVIFVVGPTAVGKTHIAIRLAEDLHGEIVSLDSRQMVCGLDIGTAKPTASQLAAVRHHLVNIIKPNEELTLRDVQALAYRAVDDILSRGLVPIVCGGTGQYVRAVREGWIIPEVPPDASLREALREEAERDGHLALHARLRSVDPIAAGRIDPRNVRRVIRALEVYERTGEPISALQDKARPPYEVLVIGLTRPRPELYARIDRRIDGMIDEGLEDEVRLLVSSGYGFGLPAMSSLGYAEWAGCLDGDLERQEVVQLIRRNTRRLVRQQGTWFRADDPGTSWFDLSQCRYDDIRHRAEQFLSD